MISYLREPLENKMSRKQGKSSFWTILFWSLSLSHLEMFVSQYQHPLVLWAGPFWVAATLRILKKLHSAGQLTGKTINYFLNSNSYNLS
jgi:hypothetical protein